MEKLYHLSLSPREWRRTGVVGVAAFPGKFFRKPILPIDLLLLLEVFTLPNIMQLLLEPLSAPRRECSFIPDSASGFTHHQLQLYLQLGVESITDDWRQIRTPSIRLLRNYLNN